MKEVDLVKFFLFGILSSLTYLIPLPLAHEAKVVFSILVFAVLLWTTETIPLFLTSLIATILLIILNVFSFNEAVIKFAHPVLILIFGGFLIAKAMEDVGLDKRIALQISSKIRNDKYELLCLMFFTAFISLWIANTAVAVLMIPIALGIVHKFKKKMPNLTKATILGIAYSASIGGVGTIIGSPPNAITVAELSEIAGISISFSEWIILALPIVLILIPLAWLILIKTFPFEEAYLKKMPKVKPLTQKQKVFCYVFLVTILLWLTTGIHGFSSSLVAISSGSFLFWIKLLKTADLNKINYRVLFLLGGGIVLGSAIFSSGLSTYFADSLASLLSQSSSLVIMLGVVLITIAFSSFAPNTVTVAVLIPLMIPLATILNFSPKTLALLTGISGSFIFLLPIGTPPNAVAYATGKISMRDMLKAGFTLTVVSIFVLILFAVLFW